MTENGSNIELGDSQELPDDYPFWLRPPFRLLTDVMQFRKVDPWDLEIANLITRFVEKMKLTNDINFPVLGRAILSAAILYRMKVNDLIKIIEESDKQEEDFEALEFDIPEIAPSLHISQRPVSFKELLYAFQGMLRQEVRYRERKAFGKKKPIIHPIILPTKPVRIVDEETTKIAIMKKAIYEKLVRLYSKKKEPILFEKLIDPGTPRVTVVHTFLCLLYLAFEIKVQIFQEEDLGEVKIIPIRDKEEEFLGGLEKVIEEKLRAGETEESITISDIQEEEASPDEK